MSSNVPSSSSKTRQQQQQHQPLSRSQAQPQAPQTLIQQHQPFPSSTSSYSIRHSTSSSSLFGPNDSLHRIAFVPGTSAGSSNSVNNFQFATAYHGQQPPASSSISSSSFDRATPPSSSSKQFRAPFRSQSVVIDSSLTSHSSSTSASTFYGAGGTGTRHGTISGAISTMTMPGPGPFGERLGNGLRNSHNNGTNGTSRGPFTRPGASTLRDALLQQQRSNSSLNSLYTIDNTTPNREYGRRHSGDEDEVDDDDDSEGGASYFGSSGQDFLLKQKRARVSKWLCWIDLLFLIIFAALTGLKPPSEGGESAGWTWSWEKLPVPLTALAILRLLVIGFTARYSHGNYNVVVIFVCVLVTLYIMFEVNMVIQHRLELPPVLIAQYTVSLLLTQFHWISYSAHTPMSATLSYAYDPVLAESITFSRESRYVGNGAFGSHARGSTNLRRGTSYGTMTTSPFDAVQELDEGEDQDDGHNDRDQDAFIKVSLDRRAVNSRKLARSRLTGRSGGDEEENEYENVDGEQEEEEEEHDMATLLAFQDARRQQVYAFSPAASSAAMPDRPILSPQSGGVSTSELGKSPLSWAFRGQDANGNGCHSGSGAGLTVGYTPRRRRVRSNMDPNGSGRRTWTGGHSIIYSGILVESSDDEMEGTGQDDEDAVEVPGFEVEEGALLDESSHLELELQEQRLNQELRLEGELLQHRLEQQELMDVDYTIKTEVRSDEESSDRRKSHEGHHHLHHHRSGTETTVKDGTNGHHENGPGVGVVTYSQEGDDNLEKADDRPRHQQHPHFKESSADKSGTSGTAVAIDVPENGNKEPEIGVVHKDDLHRLGSSHGLSTMKFNVSSRQTITAVMCDEPNCPEHPYQEGPASELEAILGKDFKGGNIVELDIKESSRAELDQSGDGINPEFEDGDDDSPDLGFPTAPKGTIKGHKKGHEGLSNTMKEPPHPGPVDNEPGKSIDPPHGSRGVHIHGRIERTTVDEEDIDISDSSRRIAGDESGYRRRHVHERSEKVTVTEENEIGDIDKRGIIVGGVVGGAVGGVIGGTIVGGRPVGRVPGQWINGQWVEIEDTERPTGVITWGIVDDIPPSMQRGAYIDDTRITSIPEPIMIIPPQRTEIVEPATPVIYQPRQRPVLVEPPPPAVFVPEPVPKAVIVAPPPRPQVKYQPPPRVLILPPAAPVYVEPPPPPPVIIQERPPPPPIPVYRPPARIIPPPPPPAVVVPEPRVVVAPEPVVVIPEPVVAIPEPMVPIVPEYGTYETIVPGAIGDIGAYGGGVGAYGGAYGGGNGPYGGVRGLAALNRGNSIASIYENERPYSVASIYNDHEVDIASIHELENGPGFVGAGAVGPYSYGHSGYDGYGGYGPRGGVVVGGGVGGVAYGQHLVSAGHLARSDSETRAYGDHSAWDDTALESAAFMSTRRQDRDYIAEDDKALASSAFINDRRLGREVGDDEQEPLPLSRNPQLLAHTASIGRGDDDDLASTSDSRVTSLFNERRQGYDGDIEDGDTSNTDRDVVMSDVDDPRMMTRNQHAAFPSDSALTETSDYHEVQIEEGHAVQELTVETYFDTTKSQFRVRQQQGQLLSEMASELKKRNQREKEQEQQQQQLSEEEIVRSQHVPFVVEFTTGPSASPIVAMSTLSHHFQQQSPPTLNIPKPPSNPPPVRLLVSRGIATPLVHARGGLPIGIPPRKGSPGQKIINRHVAESNTDTNGDRGMVPGEEENGSEPILSSSASASENIMMQLRNRDSGGNFEGFTAAAAAVPSLLTSQPLPPTDAAGSAVLRARALISNSILLGPGTTVSTGIGLKKVSSGTKNITGSTAGSLQNMRHVSKDQGTRSSASAIASKRKRMSERVAAMSRSHLHPIMLTEGITACWNNEFAYALEVFKDNGASFPRWSLATAEVHIVRQLISGQLSEPDSELMESLQLSEQVASRILDKKQEFESSYMAYRSLCSADASLITVNESTLRQNYKWDCEMSFYDTLLYRGILQLTASSDTKGTFSDIRGGLQLRRAWKGYMRIKQEIEMAKDRWQKLSTLCAQAQTQAQVDVDSDMIAPSAPAGADDKENRLHGSVKTGIMPVSIPNNPLKRSTTSVLSSSHPVEGSRWSIFGRRMSTHHSSSSLSTSPVDGSDILQGSSSSSVEPRSRSKFLASSPASKGLASALRDQAKAKEEIKTAVKVLEDVEDYLHYGLGLFYFIAAIVPKSLLPALRTIGLQSNHEQGIQLLESVFTRRNGRAPFSALFFNGSSYLLMACHHARKTGNMIPGALNHITRGIQTCEAAGIPSINYRFELGLTFFINQEFDKAADIFEILWRRFFIPIPADAAATPVLSPVGGRRKRTSRSNSINQSSFAAQESSTSMETEDEEEDEFELAPFCGLCLIASKVVVRLGQEGYFEYGREGFGHHLPSQERSMTPGGSHSGSTTPSGVPRTTPPTSSSGSDSDLLIAAQEVLAMMATPEQLNATMKSTAGGSIFEHVKTESTQSTITIKDSETFVSSHAATATTMTGSGFVAAFTPPPPPAQAGKLNRFNKFAWNQCQKSLQHGRISPFLPLVILYLRRDLAYMRPALLRKFKTLLETIWKSVRATLDGDTQAIYLLLSAVVHRQLLPDDATFAYTALTDCLLLESSIVSEMWVIPYCHYELGELLFKKLHLPQAALEQFQWVVKGPGKEVRPVSTLLFSGSTGGGSTSTASSSNNSSTAINNNVPNPRFSVYGGGYPSDTVTNVVESIVSTSASVAGALNRHSQIFGNMPAGSPLNTSSAAGVTVATVPAPPSAASFYNSRYKKFEFSQPLRQRSSICIEQIQKAISEAADTALTSSVEQESTTSSTIKASKASRRASEPPAASAVAAAVQATPSYQGWSSSGTTLPNILSDAQRRRGSQQWITGSQSQVSLKATLAGTNVNNSK
ncbi:hypothetical protein BGZ83_010968 [Gryganskiella cystojenkinii]|nr:hypothetical protein BGZ83_010968 [Gryganskiella cystojenkinii]